MKGHAYVVGAGPAGLAAALFLSKSSPDANITVFEQRKYPDVSGNEGDFPAVVHDSGARALAELGLRDAADLISLISKDGSAVPAKVYYSSKSAVLSVGCLLEKLRAKVKSCANIRIKTGVVVSGLDMENAKLFVQEVPTEGTEYNPLTAYDMPGLLVLAEDSKHLRNGFKSTGCELTSASTAAGAQAVCGVAVPDIPVDGPADVQVFSKGTTGVALYKGLRTAVVATLEGNAAVLRELAPLRALLREAGVPDAAAAAIADGAVARKHTHFAPGAASQIGFVTATGSQVALVGPSAITTAACMCLDIDAALSSAAALGHAVERGDVQHYNAAFLRRITNYTAAADAQQAHGDPLAPFGVAGGNIGVKSEHNKFVPLVGSVVTAPLRCVNAVTLKPLIGLFRR